MSLVLAVGCEISFSYRLVSIYFVYFPVEKFCDLMHCDALPRTFTYHHQIVILLQIKFNKSGIVGIKDPARPEVAESINDCTKAGIRVIMITGDAKDTAISIARDVNIFPPNLSENEDDKNIKAYEGREFFTIPEDEQLELLKTGNIVFCRAEPADKQKLIKMLQSLNEISAMTGDGVNDAPALQQADIGMYSIFINSSIFLVWTDISIELLISHNIYNNESKN